MEHKRAQTSEALEAFIQTQRALLARTQTDIERLRKLRSEAKAQPRAFVSNLSDRLSNARWLSDPLDCEPALPQDIDWAVYETCDPTPLQSLALNSRNAYAQRNQPCLTQRSELSDLQKLVKTARTTIVDPILARFEFASEPESSDDEEIDPEEVRRELEREKIRELKKRKIQSCGLKLPGFRARGPSGVFIRRDVEDESLEVDISLEDNHSHDLGTNSSHIESDTHTPSVAFPPTTRSTPTPAPIPAPAPIAKPSRARRPPKDLNPKTDDLPVDGRARRISKRQDTFVKSEPDPEPSPTSPPAPLKLVLGKRSRDAGKPKPETYKQAWSTAEQHLLEQLLEQIPEGEKNRWQKISRAMDGRRTPRQVASRVQKYFEKLKRFGIGIGVGEGGST